MTCRCRHPALGHRTWLCLYVLDGRECGQDDLQATPLQLAATAAAVSAASRAGWGHGVASGTKRGIALSALHVARLPLGA
jgi:hypothetical protein